MKKLSEARLTGYQKQLCVDYLAGKVPDRTFNILFNTFWNEYVASNGYKNLQKETEKQAYTNFCNYVLKGRK